MSESTSWTLALNRCPHGVEMISLDNAGGGTNLTGNKCCGRWTVIKEWPMSASRLKDAADEIEAAAELSQDSPTPPATERRRET